MLRIHILAISIIQLNRNLTTSIRALSGHKIAKWTDSKSKMAATATILKTSFRHLFSNLWSLWAETCFVATGWHLDRNELTLCRLEIQDGCNGSALWNKIAARAKNRKSSNDISSLAIARFQNICTEVFFQWPSTKIVKMIPIICTKWQLELKIEKPFKNISAASVPISK